MKQRKEELGNNPTKTLWELPPAPKPLPVLSKEHEAIIRAEIAQSHEWTRKGYKNTVTQEMSYSPQTKNGWFSSSEKTPLKGGIDFPINNGPIVMFTCKYRRQHIGVLSGFHWMEGLEGYYPAHMVPVIKVYEKLVSKMDTINCMVSVKSLGKGYKLPEVPDLSSFEVIK